MKMFFPSITHLLQKRVKKLLT